MRFHLHLATIALYCNWLKLEPPVYFYRMGKSAIAGFLVMAVFLLHVLAVSPALHHWFHQEASNDNHVCAVSLVSGGQMLLAQTAPPVLGNLPFSYLGLPTADHPLVSLLDRRLAPSRAPPALLFSSTVES